MLPEKRQITGVPSLCLYQRPELADATKAPSMIHIELEIAGSPDMEGFDMAFADGRVRKYSLLAPVTAGSPPKVDKSAPVLTLMNAAKGGNRFKELTQVFLRLDSFGQ
eukprot:1403101-Pyramimonas_sp.AAC.1